MFDIRGHGKIELMENGKVVETIPILSNTITYSIGLWIACAICRRGLTSAMYNVISQIKFGLGNDTVTTSTRGTSNLANAFVPVKEVTISYLQCTFTGVVIQEGGSGTPARLSVTFTGTFPIGTFNGSETVGEIGLWIRTGTMSVIVDGVSGLGANKYILLSRISVADGDFVSVTPTVVQGIVVTYQIDL